MLARASMLPFVALLSVTVALGAGCQPNFAGEYDGEATLTLGPSHAEFLTELKPGMKFPVHVSVGQQTFSISGPPFAGCSPKVVDVSRSRGMLLSFDGGVCKVTTKSGPVALVDGGGGAAFKDDKLELFYNGQDLMSVAAKRR